MRDDASELRIAIGRVLERWQLERAGLDPDSSEQQRERFELLSRHIDEVKRAITPARVAALAALAAADTWALRLHHCRDLEGTWTHAVAGAELEHRGEPTGGAE